MDNQLILILINHLSALNLYNEHDLNKSVEVLQEKQVSQSKLSLSQQPNLESSAKDILSKLVDSNLLELLSQDKFKNLQVLKEKLNLNSNDLNKLFDYGYYLYSIGNFNESLTYLSHFKLFSTSFNKIISTHWGLLSSHILLNNKQESLITFYELKDLIDKQSNNHNQVIQLQQRSSLLHWSLFIFFKNLSQDDGHQLLNQFLDLLNHSAYLNTLQTTCPWLLRYLIIATITNSFASNKQKTLIKELFKLTQIETYQFNDPTTNFLINLYSTFNFSQCLTDLKEIEDLFNKDYFLIDQNLKNKFLYNAKYYYIETFLKIHSKVSLSSLSNDLNITVDDIKSLLFDSNNENDGDDNNKFEINNDGELSIKSENQLDVRCLNDRVRHLSFRSSNISLALSALNGELSIDDHQQHQQPNQPQSTQQQSVEVA